MENLGNPTLLGGRQRVQGVKKIGVWRSGEVEEGGVGGEGVLAFLPLADLEGRRFPPARERA